MSSGIYILRYSSLVYHAKQSILSPCLYNEEITKYYMWQRIPRLKEVAYSIFVDPSSI